MNHIIQRETFPIYCNGTCREIYKGDEQGCKRYLNILNKYMPDYYYTMKQGGN
jgi:hypothetical protein